MPINNHPYFLNLNCWINYERGASSFYSTSLNSSMKNIKCLKQVFKWYYSPSAMIIWKWVWYMCAYTLNNLLNIVFIIVMKFFGNGTPAISTYQPIWHGNNDSLLNWFYTHVISSSMYYGAGTFRGVFTF